MMEGESVRGIVLVAIGGKYYVVKEKAERNGGEK